MIAALLIGRDGSKGFPGKNTAQVLGRPLFIYPLLAGLKAPSVDAVFISTDSLEIQVEARSQGARRLYRPPELYTDTALGEDVVLHSYHDMNGQLGKLEFLVLLLCNSPTILPETIEAGIEVLRADPSLDSAITVSRYNMWSPLRARKIGDDGLLHPMVPFETFGDPAKMSCDRDSQGDVWFADMGMSIMRPRCFENMHNGLLPQRWMGQRIYPVLQWGGLDIDYPWQMPQAEHWLRVHGFAEDRTPYATALQHA